MSVSNLTLLARFGSSASWRVRCALNYKHIEYDTRPVNLLDMSDENGRKLLQLNPASRVPVLIHGERVITESLAIIEYLEENFDGPRLLPLIPTNARAPEPSHCILRAASSQCRIFA
ncbi:hypothetical protein PENTCL1PPCAC_14897 [Pristionchus entomophagus]|uniref:GST N-terminal domain-containing protein n=1 Tax=Pristionchus entomophagus TaxID=358040 RepID=A0AAV5TCV0_9BILA|nr:hypothetical protein PENTCL1PPCAC_14897 [Pristionchus entomophagus]